MSRNIGIMPAATAVDDNKSLFPLAYAVVDAENDKTEVGSLLLRGRVIIQHASSFLESRNSCFWAF